MKKILSKRYEITNTFRYYLTNNQKNRIEIINKRNYTLVDVECPICKSGKKLTISERDKYGFNLEFSVCKDCGHLFQSRRYDLKSLKSFYENDFSFLDQGFTKKQKFIFEDLYTYAENDLTKILSKIPKEKINNILEIGCNNGGALMHFKEQGKTTKGIDLDPKAISYGKKMGLDIEINSIEQFETDTKYDLIYLISVLEHIPNLRESTKKISKLLSPGGYLFIKAPGLLDLHNKSFYKFDLLDFLTLPHLHYFTEDTLNNLMGLYGMECVHSDKKLKALFIKNDKYSKITNYFNINYKYLKQQKKYKILFRQIRFNIYRRVVDLIKSLLKKIGMFSLIIL
jgi:2-polyprenyl-3-methyl-5-hydroxy-6-metoxy-1,4-benzoquinol methylase